MVQSAREKNRSEHARTPNIKANRKLGLKSNSKVRPFHLESIAVEAAQKNVKSMLMLRKLAAKGQAPALQVWD